MMHEPHNVATAMARGEVSEEEAYFLLRFAGRMGYDRAIKRLTPRSPVQRVRRWVIWFGGWETTELGQWDHGEPAWRFGHGPTPISLFGGRLTFYSWGGHLRLHATYLCFVWTKRQGRSLYLSPNTTPWAATRFFFGKRND